jgi:hypothetical protein
VYFVPGIEIHIAGDGMLFVGLLLIPILKQRLYPYLKGLYDLSLLSLLIWKISYFDDEEEDLSLLSLLIWKISYFEDEEEELNSSF